MPKFLSLFIAAILTFLSISPAMATKIELTGDARIKFVLAEEEPRNTFAFERLALRYAFAITENYGLTSDIQFDQAGKNSGTKTDIRLNTVVFYYKNLVSCDQLEIGYLDLAFNSQSYRAMAGSIAESGQLANPESGKLLYDLLPANSVGVRYHYFADEWHGFFALVNASHAENQNTPDVTGFDYVARVEYRPWDFLTLGAGGSRNTDALAGYFQAYGVDLDFTARSTGFFVEYVSLAPHQVDGFTDSSPRTGGYWEGRQAITSKTTVYLGGSIAAAELTGNTRQDYRLAGVKYVLAPNQLTLQSEILSWNNHQWSWSTRFQVNF